MILASKYIFVHVPKTGGASIEKALHQPLSGPLHATLRSVRKGKRFAFGFVRNPWDRLVSMYCWYCQRDDMPPHRLEAQALARARGFKWWLTEWQKTPRDQALSFRSQMYWLDGCDRIGCFESLQAHFRTICAEQRIATGPLPHINRSKHGHYSTFYDDKTVRVVARLYSPEISKFGYEFQQT